MVVKQDKVPADARVKVDCLFCDKTFENDHELQVHFKVHENDFLRKFTSCVSESSFNKCCIVANPINIHGVNPLENCCLFCDQVFATEGELNNHFARHKNDFKRKVFKINSQWFVSCKGFV